MVGVWGFFSGSEGVIPGLQAPYSPRKSAYSENATHFGAKTRVTILESSRERHQKSRAKTVSKNLPFGTFSGIPWEYFQNFFCTFLIIFLQLFLIDFDFHFYKNTSKGILLNTFLAPITNNGQCFSERVVNTLQCEGRTVFLSGVTQKSPTAPQRYCWAY